MPPILALDETTDPTAKLFGEQLKQRRGLKKLTQGELSKLTGITPAYVSLIERGRANPTLDMMVKLADAVGAQVWDLVRPVTDNPSE